MPFAASGRSRAKKAAQPSPTRTMLISSLTGHALQLRDFQTAGMKNVFVSGCYDILHSGHLKFFRTARSLGDYLVVSFASADVLWAHKQRQPSLPDEHKYALLQNLRMVDEVVVGRGLRPGLDFEDCFRKIRPDILAVTTDDQFGVEKRQLCREVGAEYCILEKAPPPEGPLSNSSILNQIRAPRDVPLRVDFAGGWLDVPRFAREGGFIVNCAIQPKITLAARGYEPCSGLGGGAAESILRGRDAVSTEIAEGVGWQDPAVIQETGLCVWLSGSRPQLYLKRDPSFLTGKMAILWTGQGHHAAALVDEPRDLAAILEASKVAAEAVECANLEQLARAVRLSYRAQRDEGMEWLPEIGSAIGCKYCGSGWGGYGLYIFSSDHDRSVALHGSKLSPVEPYTRHY